MAGWRGYRGPVPAQLPSASAAADPLVSWVRTALKREPSGAADLAAAADASLDLTAGQALGLSDLFETGSQRLSAILRDGESRGGYILRVRRFRLMVADLDDRGLRAGYLVAGVVDIDEAHVPVLLKRCSLRTVGGTDATITLDGGWRLNPVLRDAVRGLSRSALDLESVVQSSLQANGSTWPGEPDTILDEVGAVLSGLRLTVRRRLVLAPLTLDSDHAVAGLERVAHLVAGHPVLAAAARRVGAVGTTAPAAPRAPGGSPTAPASPVGQPSVVDGHATAVLDAALDDVLTIDVDRDQREALRVVLGGRNAVVDAPPATGATTVAVAVAVMAATTGRRCLLLTPTRTQGDIAQARLRANGVTAGVVLGPQNSPTDHSQHPVDVPAVGADGAESDAEQRRRDAAAEFAAARDQLTRIRQPWATSRLAALNALAGLDGEVSDVSVTWPPDEASRIPITAAVEVIDAVTRAITLGAAEESLARSPWRLAVMDDDADAARALELARLISGPLAQRVRTAITELAALTGTAEARTLREVDHRRQLFTGLQATLDRLTPEVFDIPVLDLVAATASKDFRRRTDYAMPAMARRTLVARAKRLVRPGVDIRVPQLHDLLVAAAHQRVQWQQIAEGAGWAHVPADVPARIRVLTEFSDCCAELAAHHGALAWDRSDPDGHSPTVEDVITLTGRLAESADELRHLPHITRLDGVWTQAGLGDVVPDLYAQLAAREADAAPADERAAVALWRAYWTAVADDTAAAAATDSEGSVTRYIAADQEYRRRSPQRVGARIRERLHASAEAWQAGAPWCVRIAVASDLVAVDDDERYDVVVIDDAGASPFVDVVAAIARSSQVVVLGDGAQATPDSAWSVIQGITGDLVRHVALTYRHRRVAITHAAGSRQSGHADRAVQPVVQEIPLAQPPGVVTFTHLPQAAALPVEGDDYADTSAVEVAHVVDAALALARRVCLGTPPRSLAIVALTRSHAGAVALGLRAALRARPVEAAAFTADGDEPIVVVSADQARGIERDVVLLTVGFPRTPHGRVLHRFGPLDSAIGAGLVATAVTRSRDELHVVSGLRAADLDPARLHSEGARAVSALLTGAELAAAAPIATAAPPRISSGGPSTGSGVIDLVSRDLRERGWDVGAGPEGVGLRVSGVTGAPVVVDHDIEFVAAATARARDARLREGGWHHVLVAVEAVAADRVGVLAGIEDLLTRPSVGALPSRSAGQSSVGTLNLVDVRQTVAVGERSRDDSDLGWNDSTSVLSDDDRLRAERPPHW